MTDLDYTMARPAGTFGSWERVIDDDYPSDPETGMPLGGPDMFRLEHSGWNRYVIFKPKVESE